MNEIAVTILLFLSSLLGVENYPKDVKHDWEITKVWEEDSQGYFNFVASNNNLIRQCKNNPSHYIKFPSTIHSSSQVIVNGQIIAITSSPDFKHIKGFYGSLVIPCFQLQNVDEDKLIWKVKSYTRYFAWFKYFPELVEEYPKDNLFNETVNIAAAGILLIICLIYLVLFTGKISNEKLISLIASNFFTSFYFIANSAQYTGFSMSMLMAHKIADSGLWIGLTFFIHFLYLEKLIPRWMNIVHRIAIIIALIIILPSETGDSIQLGTSIPFLFTIAIPGYAIVVLMKKGELKSRKDTIQLIALFLSFFVYWNDIFVVTGIINFFPLLPLGIPGTNIFILFGVNESIANTYNERDQLKVLTEQLKKTNYDLKKTQDELVESEKMAVMGRAVARIAHELNTPIYIVRSSAQNIKTQTSRLIEYLSKGDKKDLPDKIKQYEQDLDSMSQGLMGSVSRAAELVRNFKAISADQVNGEKKKFHLLDYMDSSLNTMQGFLDKEKIEVKLSGDNVLLYNDPGIFYQIINNLVDNTAKHAYKGKGGTLNIEIKDCGNEVELSFTDHGAGIPEENLSKVFDPFFTTAGGLGGVGLGLNIVYRLVNNSLGGSISCETELEKGTIFKIIIPNIDVKSQ